MDIGSFLTGILVPDIMPLSNSYSERLASQLDHGYVSSLHKISIDPLLLY